MSDAVSFAEIEGQHVELLPARTVMSLFTTGGHGCGCEGGHSGGNGGVGGAGGKGTGGIALLSNLVNVNILGDQVNSAADGFGGAGGSANGGHG